ncbi:MAG: plasmid pRiA4b ORF-3 family protein [Candidatus Cloacimonetes bacterium]|nr:plasmid pRiA4b ORF-3 family protein [Candidatus Cloacimonadota bacterium]
MKIRFYLLHIKLANVEYDVWRKLIVPSNISLDRLHDVLQIAMSWEDYGSHYFLIKGETFHDVAEDEEEQEDWSDDDERIVSLDEVITKKGEVFQYFYNNDTTWELQIKLENDKLVYPRQELLVECLSGNMFAPLEDLHSLEEYKQLYNVLDEPDSELFKEMLGNNPFTSLIFSKGSIDPHLINAKLREFLLWSRDRAMDWFDLQDLED